MPSTGTAKTSTAAPHRSTAARVSLSPAATMAPPLQPRTFMSTIPSLAQQRQLLATACKDLSPAQPLQLQQQLLQQQAYLDTLSIPSAQLQQAAAAVVATYAGGSGSSHRKRTPQKAAAVARASKKAKTTPTKRSAKKASKVKPEPDLEGASHSSASMSSPEGLAFHSGPSTHAAASSHSSTPRNTLETSMVQYFTSIGYANAAEILRAVRVLVQDRGIPSHQVSTDDVQREIRDRRDQEAEDRMMDQARLLSEQSRKEEAQRRRAIVQWEWEQRVWECTSTNQWLAAADMFPRSWLLQDPPLAACLDQQLSAIKTEVVEVLKLERQAQRWYRGNLPYAYFMYRLRPRLVACAGSSLPQALQQERQALQTCLYTLSEQTATGVPKVFLEAHDEAVANKQLQVDDVEVVASPAGAVAASLFASSPAKQKSSPAKKVSKDPSEVIEIL